MHTYHCGFMVQDPHLDVTSVLVRLRFSAPNHQAKNEKPEAKQNNQIHITNI